MYKLVIHKTNNYPYYEKAEETFRTLDEAETRMNEISKELMRKYREYKAKKIFARLGGRVQRHIESCIELYAKANAKDDKVAATEWRARIAGVLTGLEMMDVITIKEELLLNEYAISQSWDKAEEIKNGAA